MEETILQKLKPARAESLFFAFGVCVGLAVPYLLPYWRLFAFVGIMGGFVWWEFKKRK